MEIYLNNLDWLIFVAKILLAVICGLVIGIEREFLGKPAGVKTNSIICLGACIYTHFSFLATDGDPTRIAAQVVSGIGFIGAGTILQSKQRIEGLTSASLVFVNAAIGMLIGGGFFLQGIIGTTCLLILYQFIKNTRFQSKLRTFKINLLCSSYKDVQTTLDFLVFLQCRIKSKKIEKSDNNLEVSVTYSTTPLANHRIISKIHKLDSIKRFTQT